jgi:uncharacterized protein YndB with AHSA1/START domain
MNTNDRHPATSTMRMEDRPENERRIEEQLADTPPHEEETAFGAGPERLRAEATINVEAPVHAVWTALTDPAWVEQYFFGTRLRTTWKPGEPITFSGIRDGKAYEDKGTVLSSHPPERLTYSYRGAADERTSIITYAVDKAGPRTRVTITQDGCSDAAHCDRCAQNWQQVLQSLKKVVEPA